VVSGTTVARRGPQAVWEEKHRKVLSDTELMKNTPTHVCAETALVDLELKVSELFLSITSCPSIIISENASNWRIGSMWLW
jgi:hypothetical protein